MGGRGPGHRRVLVIVCHPDPESLVAAAASRVLSGLAATTAEVRCRDLYAERFDPRFGAEEHEQHLVPGVAPSIRSHADDLRWCDTLVFVYPTWWSSQPAMLKGWFDRVLACGVAWDYDDERGRLRPGLRNIRSIHAVVTHGSSKSINVLEGEGGKRVLSRALRPLCHPMCRTRWHALYGIDVIEPAERSAFLDRIEATFASLR